MEGNTANGGAMYTPDSQILKASARDKSEHILVFARVRPMNGHERTKSAIGVIDCPGSREVVVRERTNLSSVSKTFTFDRVFGPLSKQIDVYKAVVSPLLEEVLLGYNCTVFAYGQTGTGKTFTMEGERSAPANGDAAFSWESDPLAGIVPRAMSQLFDELRLANSEFTVRVSLVEMYNEEVYDLLSPTEDAKPRTVRLYEDSSRKGSVHIQGLEEVIVHNKHEVYAIMERGSQMRKTASTLLNANSSRSHTVFTVTVHIKESNVMGEDLLKIGKLHLVDLAGSENIGRSGAVDKRAREAGNINQSLLTLGRVITALVERAPHIPYRESKLTRLLQDSLGGRTKTSIIATVSPASINLEETLSTLDYAHRAKNIQNRPEVNQKLTKKAMLKEYTEEIERLRRDLVAAREKNGIFVDKENYEHMMNQLASQGQDLSEKIQHTKSLEEQVQQKETEITEVKAVLVETQDDLNTANVVIESQRVNINNLEVKLADTKNKKEEMEHLVKVRTDTETKLTKEATTLLSTAAETTVNLDTLYNRLERKKNVEETNREAGNRFRGDFDEQLKTLAWDIKDLSEVHSKFSGNQRLQLDDFLTKKETKLQELNVMLSTFSTNVKGVYDKITEIANEQESSNKEVSGKLESCLKKIGHKSGESLAAFLKNTFLSQTSELLAYFQHAREELSSIVMDVKEYVANDTEVVNEYVTARLYSFSNQIDNVKNLSKVTSTQRDSFKATYKTHHERDTKIMVEMAAATKAALTQLESCIAMSNSLQENLTQEQQFVDSYIDTQAAYVNETVGQLLKKLTKDGKETQALPVQLTKLADKILSEVDTRKERVYSLQQQHTDGIATMDKDAREIVKVEKELWEDVQKTTVDRLKTAENDVSLKAEKLRSISNQLHTNQDDHKEELKAELSQGVETDRQYVERSRADFFTNCDSVSRCTEEFQQRLHMQSGKLNEFWDSTYLIDLPTGATPQRKAYIFPKNLSATSPHERVLGRYRNLRMQLHTIDFDGSDREVSPMNSTSGTCRSGTGSSTSSAPDTPRSIEDIDENRNPHEAIISSSVNDISKLGGGGDSMASMGPPTSVGKAGAKGLARSATDLTSINKGQSKSKPTNAAKTLGSTEKVNKRVDKNIPNKKGNNNKKVLTTPN